MRVFCVWDCVSVCLSRFVSLCVSLSARFSVPCCCTCVYFLAPGSLLLLSSPHAVHATKAGGDEQFRAGDFPSAIATFTTVLEREPRFVGALTNRAAAHLATNNLDACIADCGAALVLLGAEGAAGEGGAIDPVPPKGSARHRTFTSTTLIRRGTALCKQERYAEAVEDYTSALKLDPSNVQLAQDIKKAKARTAVAPSDFAQ